MKNTKEFFVAACWGTVGVLGTVALIESIAQPSPSIAELDDKLSTIENELNCLELEAAYNAEGPHYAPGEEDWSAATTIPFETASPDC